jgi:hypothetical protein
MNCRKEIALGVVLSILLALLVSSCGGGGTPPPTQTSPSANLSSSSLTFTGQLVGTASSGQTVTLTNSGNGALTISAIALSGTNSSDFSEANTCGTSVAGGANCTITVTFKPTAAGSRTASVTITDNATGSPQSISLTGTGTAPVAALSATTLTFSNQAVSTTSAAQTVTVSNTGNAPLAITSIAFSGTNSSDFASQGTSTCSTTSPVAAAGSCNVNIAFTPSIKGAESATLTVTDNSGAVAGSTQMVTLSGTGALPTISGTVTKGAVSGATVTVYQVNSNGSNGTQVSSGKDITDANGNFSVGLTAVPTGQVRISVSGGTYPSEWNNATVTSSSTVTALFDSVGSGISGASVTAVSTFVDSNASGSLSNGSATSNTSAHAAAESLIGGLYGLPAGTNVETLPATFTSSSIGTAGFQLGLVVGTLTAEGLSLDSSDPDGLIAAMGADISDGVWNGLAFGSPVVLGDPNLPATAGTTDFTSSLGTYVGSGYSPTANGVTTTNASAAINSIDTGVATCKCTPAAVGLAATSSGAINGLSFTPSNSTTSGQFLFVAARESGVVAINVTNPTLAGTGYAVKAWPQLYYNQPGSGGFGQVDVGGVIPFVGTAGHPQALVLAYSSKHILVVNLDTLVTGTPGLSNPVDAEMDVPISATAPVEFSGGSAYIGSGIPLGGSILALATADGYMIFDASQVGAAGGNPVVKLYPVQDPNEIIAENMGGDPSHRYLLAANEAGGAQLVDLSAGLTDGTSYYITPGTDFANAFPGTLSGTADGNAVDPALQVGILTFEDTADAELVNMATISKTVSTTIGVLNSWAPAASGVAHVTFGTTSPPTLSGSAVDSTSHLAQFMAGYSTSLAIGQIQNPTSVATGAAWEGLSDWSYVPDITSLSKLGGYGEAHDPHADGVIYNLMEQTPYGYLLDGSSNQGVVQTDMAGFMAIGRAGTTGDAAHMPGTDPTTVTNSTTGGPVMEEITWVNPMVVTSTTFTAYVGTTYAAGQLVLQASGGTAPYTWTSSGTLPLGITGVDSSGDILGTPTTAGTYTFTVTAKDSTTPTANTASAPIVLNVVPPPPSITTTSPLPVATQGSSYSATIKGAGGNLPYTWTISSGTLPAGLTFTPASPSATISGTPTVAGVFSFTITLTDSTTPTPQTISQSMSITVNSSVPLSVPSTITLPTGSIYSGYSGNLASSFTGGTPPFTCTITSGTLPAGLAQNPSNTCTIQGVPTAITSGAVSLGVSVADSTSPTHAAGTSTAMLTVSAATNNAELNGHYAFLLTGFDSYGYADVMAGSFTADGNGNITGGVEDINDSINGYTNSLAFTGVYGVGPDNRGGMVITAANDTTFTALFSLGTITSGVANIGHMEEFDTSENTLSGTLRLQESAAFTTASLATTFAFGFVGGYDGRLAAGGVFTANGAGNLTNGEADLDNDSSVSSAVSFTGTYGIPTTGTGTSNGRGTLTMTIPTVGTLDLAFYVVSPTSMYLVSTDPAASSFLSSVYGGEAVAQTGGPYSNSSLDGTSILDYAALSASTTVYGYPYPDVTAGILTTNGSGSFTLTSDENDAGSVTTGNVITGTYSVASNGRVTVTITSGGGSSPQPPVLYLTAPNTAFIVGTDTGSTFGEFEPQAAGPFTVSSLSGNYILGTQFGEGAAPGTQASSGVLSANGSGTLTGKMDNAQLQLPGGYINGFTLQPAQSITETYTAGSNGRVTVSDGSVVFYIISSSKLIVINTGATSSFPAIYVVGQ